MIVPPIVLEDRDGCLAFYDSTDQAIANMDLDDVLDREYSAYDSQGRLLSVEPTEEGGGAVATMEARETAPGHEEQLRAALLRALRLKGINASTIANDLPLPQLLDEALRHKRGYHLP